MLLTLPFTKTKKGEYMFKYRVVSKGARELVIYRNAPHRKPCFFQVVQKVVLLIYIGCLNKRSF